MTAQAPAIRERGAQTARKLRGNGEMGQITGKKADMPNFPPLCFIASPSVDLIWQVLLHDSQTHRPPRLIGRGPRWPLSDRIPEALMEQLHFLSCFPRAGMARPACSAACGRLTDYARDQGPQANAHMRKGGAALAHLCWLLKVPAVYDWQCNPCGL